MLHLSRVILLVTVSLVAFAACSSSSTAPSSEEGNSEHDGGDASVRNEAGASEGDSGPDRTDAGAAKADASAGAGTMTVVDDFGSNPGALKMYAYVPASMPANAPLVVALHGCLQSAADYESAGWNELADVRKAYVVYPEQSAANNAQRCFDWFQATDATRGAGEALSIKQMVDYMLATYSIDGSKVYVTGLSAGGAMTAVMLATYPDVFAAGAVMSGVPYGCASSAYDAVTCMTFGKTLSPGVWSALVKNGDPGFAGTYPRLSVWHGQSDTTVNEVNAGDLVSQWTALFGLGQTPTVTETVATATHTVFEDGAGRPLVERYSIPGMGHGTALDPPHGCGTAQAYMLDEGICSTSLAWAFFTE